MLNQLPTTGTLAAPRSILKVGDKVIEWDGWDTEHNGIFEAGTIRVDVPARFADWAWWTQQTEILVDVYVGFPKDPMNYSASDLTLLQTFRIDSIRPNWKTLGISLSGRDLTSLLTDQKIDIKFPNQTASQVVTQIAQQVGLTPNVQATTDLVGHYFTLDHVSLHHEKTMWTLLTYLAQHEGFQCFVLGHTLYFGQFSSALSNEPYLIQCDPPTTERPYPTSNADELEFEHDLTLAQDVKVRVRSYHGNKNAVYTSIATASRTAKRVERSAALAQSVQQFDFIFNGLTQAQCDAKAQQLLEQISKHELKMSARLSGETKIYPWTPILVQGTGTPFDTTYQAARVRRTCRAKPAKFEVVVHGKTVTAQQTVALS
jgi:phage protein D